jgi:glutathione S-transferase
LKHRSPLVDWYLLEQNIPYQKNSGRAVGHPFGQVPFLTDDTADGRVEVFESGSFALNNKYFNFNYFLIVILGAILLYLADAYGGNITPFQRAKYTKWIVWANSELDSLCFGKGMSGTTLDKVPLDSPTSSS